MVVLENFCISEDSSHALEPFSQELFSGKLSEEILFQENSLRRQGGHIIAHRFQSILIH